MKKSKTKNGIISFILAVAICLSFQLTAMAKTTLFELNFVNGNNYTVATGTKTTSNDYVTFAVTSGAPLEMWASHYKSGIVLTQGVKVNVGDKNIKAYYKTGHSADKGDKLKARAQLYSRKGDYKVKGGVNFQ